MSGIPYKCGETMKRAHRETSAAAPEGKELREKARKALPRHFLLDTSTGTLALDFEIPEPLEEIEELL